VTIAVKICGISTRDALDAAIDGGAAYVGFVFFAASPRVITPDRLETLAANVPEGVVRTGLFVDASDAEIAAAAATGCLDLLQLHGGETPGRVAEVRGTFRLPVMKAVAIAGESDIGRARAYEPNADRLLFDAKPPPAATRPGGNALSFDWALIRGQAWTRPWMLAGGLDASNLGEAVAMSGAAAVDVSSGVEDSPGVKSPALIREFLKIAESL